MEKETDQGNEMVRKFGTDAINFIFEKVKECVGKGRGIWGLWK